MPMGNWTGMGYLWGAKPDQSIEMLSARFAAILASLKFAMHDQLWRKIKTF
jgi:hypothetical protein